MKYGSQLSLGWYGLSPPPITVVGGSRREKYAAEYDRADKVARGTRASHYEARRVQARASPSS